MSKTERIFVIRIYRHKDGNPSELLGIIEDSMSGRKTAFKSLDEISSVLLGDDADHEGGNR